MTHAQVRIAMIMWFLVAWAVVVFGAHDVVITILMSILIGCAFYGMYRLEH